MNADKTKTWVVACLAATLANGAGPQQIYSLAWGPVIAVGGYKETRLRDGATLKGNAEAVRGLAFSRDGKLLATAGGLPARKGEVLVWDLASQKVKVTISGHSDCIYAVAFSPDGGTLATAGYDKVIKIWDAASGKEVRTLRDHIDAIYALAFTADGKRIVTGSADRAVKVWDAESGERLYTLSESTDGVNAIALSPDGRRVAAGGLDKTIRVWSLGEKEGTLRNTLIAHEDAILRLAWSADGEWLASASADRSIKIFRAADLTEVRAITKLPDWAFGLEFAPDGKTLAAGFFNGQLEIYSRQ
ncbi:MAG TPA: WD40 repeat domain-containing protein [Candidatus Solibacter sp.]|jgi:WD40 repeat protein